MFIQENAFENCPIPNIVQFVMPQSINEATIDKKA